MTLVRRFFFYGTLLHGSENRVARRAHRALVSLGPARVRGRLYAIPDRRGWYPALVSGAGWVHGYLYAARRGFSPADLARLDAYEQCWPGNRMASQYWREAIMVRHGSGRRFHAQVYRHVANLPRGATEITGGDFREWLKAKGGRPFREG